MKFGTIKSKIDKVLLESFNNKERFKKEMKNFQKHILENKNLTKLFWIYDELKNKAGIEDPIVNEYITESINQYNKIIPNVNSKDIISLNEWIKGIETENLYSDIDNLFSDSVLNIEEKINSKKRITESLKRKPKIEKSHINLPISAMVNIANKTINNHIENLSEEDKSKLMKLLSSDSGEMEKKYNVVKEEVINKLTKIQKDSDNETSNRIDETINKISEEKFDKLNLFRLEELNNSI